ncbi:MAG: DUF1499 domain-containing protein [Halieaceae bacterium]|nr:DUF1499 domain-containing protein [Halieaceae bacterium]
MNTGTIPSFLIRWCGRLALLCIAGIVLSVLGVRLGLLHYSTGLMGLIFSCQISVGLLTTVAAVSLVTRFRVQRPDALKSVLATLPGVLLAIYLRSMAGDYPVIHDISTDTENPPVFLQGVTERGAGANSLAIKPGSIEQQLLAYPELGSIHSRLGPEPAMAQAAEIATALGWEIYNKDPQALLIEATHTSFWFGFVDDIVIRFNPTADGTVIDLRSVSRVGRGDVGANAKRIQAFARDWALVEPAGRPELPR